MFKKTTLYLGPDHGSVFDGITSELAIKKFLELKNRYAIVAIVFLEVPRPYSDEFAYKNYLSQAKPFWL